MPRSLLLLVAVLAIAAISCVVADRELGLLHQASTGIQDSEDQQYFQNEFIPWVQRYSANLPWYQHRVLRMRSTQELVKRFDLWKQSYAIVKMHNRDPANTWTMELNAFAAETFEEFSRRQNLDNTLLPQECSATAALTRRIRDEKSKIMGLANISAQQQHSNKLPDRVDWREKGVVTPVKNQGKCGSCWAFSSTGSLESHWALKTGKLLSLAEQQLVDCAGAFDNHGCMGGLPSQAFEYIKYAGGIQASDTYPYTAKDDKCVFNATAVVVKSRGSYNFTEGDENDIVEKLATTGPVSIAYQVVSDFRLYKNGVYQSKDCKSGPMDINHAVLAVGYGSTVTGEPYFIVKNSWGTDFGMEGYFWIKRGVNMCGVATCSSYPLV